MEIDKLYATKEEIKEARIPVAWRDNCAPILIKLNECRKETLYRMNKCTELRHEYEKCQYEDLQRRKELYEQQEQNKKNE